MKPLIYELALAAGIKKPALRRWQERGSVPWKWRKRLMDDARARGKRLAHDDMEFALAFARRAA